METVYYHLDARRVTVCDMASGEAQPVRRYACLRPAAQAQAQPGKILDLEAYRRKLERQEEPEEFSQAPAEECAAAPRRAPTPSARTRRFAFTLDLCATAAVLVMTVVVVGRFLF